MRALEVIEGTWLVAQRHPPKPLGTLTIRGDTYRFEGNGAPLPEGVCFIEKPTGTLGFFFKPGTSTDTDVATLPHPPPGHLPVIHLVAVTFKDSALSTYQFRIALDAAAPIARFWADFHATPWNDPCDVTRTVQ